MRGEPAGIFAKGELLITQELALQGKGELYLYQYLNLRHMVGGTKYRSDVICQYFPLRQY